MPFSADWGHEHEAWSALAGVVLGLGLLHPAVQVRPERRHALGSLERLVEAEEAQDHVGPDLLQPLVGAPEVLGAVADRDLIARDGEVADDDVLLRELCVEQGLEMAVMLHPIGQSAADQGDVAAGIEFEALRCCRQAMLDQAARNEGGKWEDSVHE